jgi:hypothetical protein
MRHSNGKSRNNPLSSAAREAAHSGPRMRNEVPKMGSVNVLQGENSFAKPHLGAPSGAAGPLHQANKLGSEQRRLARPRNKERIP